MLAGENYFLEEWYEKDITDFDIYEKFLQKHLLNKGTGRFSLENIQNSLKVETRIEIPLRVLNDLFLTLNKGYPNSFTIKDGFAEIAGIPIELEEYFKEVHKKFHADIQHVYEKFNQYYKREYSKEIDFETFQKGLGALEDSFLYNEGSEQQGAFTDDQKVIFEYVKYVFQSHKYSTLQDKLSRILHSVLVYTYFTSSSSENNFLSEKDVFFDTNVIIYLLGANLAFRQKFIEELLTLLQDLNCNFYISSQTLLEAVRILRKPPNAEVLQFVSSQRKLTERFLANPRSEVSALFEKHKLTISVVDHRILEDDRLSNKDWLDLEKLLAQHKYKIHGSEPYPASVTHDIALTYLIGLLQPAKDLQSIRKYLITTDRLLVKWLKDLNLERNLSYIVGAFTISKITMFLWVKSRKKSREFIAHTWSYVVNSLKMFNNPKFNAIYRIAEQVFYQDAQHEPRSFYLLVKEHEKFDDAKDETDNARIMEFFSELGGQYKASLKKEISDLQTVIRETRDHSYSQGAENQRLRDEVITKSEQLVLKNQELAGVESRLHDTQSHLDKTRRRNIDLEEIERHPIRYGIIRFLERHKNFLTRIILKLLLNK